MISDIITDIIDKLIIEIKKTENITRIEKSLIDPLIQYAFYKLWPYLLIVSIIFLLTFVLSIIILLLQVKQLRKLL
mgnify:CR=1 FL=1|tara:strand:+ start:444 stop:671 length:228 start_codon:yes stop_codon:yes gene_type:complete